MARLQQNSAAAAANSASVAFGSNVAAGSLVVIIGQKRSVAGNAFVAGDCTKTAGTAVIGTIALDANVLINIGGPPEIAVGIWSVLVTTGGSLTLQVAQGSGLTTQLAIAEYDGSWDAARLEDTSTGSNAANDTSADSGNGISAGAAVFVGGVGTASNNTVAITEDAAWSLIAETNATADGVTSVSAIDRIVATGTTDSASWTLGNNSGWGAALAVYKEAAGGDIAATGTATFGASAGLNATGSLASAGALAFAGSADLDATGTLAAAAALAFAGAADLDATGTLAATGAITWAASADLDAVGSLAAIGALLFGSSADLDAIGSLAAAGAIAWTSSADLTSGSVNDIAATGSLAFGSSADLDAIGEMVAAGAIAITGTADLDAIGTMAAASLLSITGAADLDATGSLVAVGVLLFASVADLDAIGALLASDGMTFGATALLTDANAAVQPEVRPVTLHDDRAIMLNTERRVIAGQSSLRIDR